MAFFGLFKSDEEKTAQNEVRQSSDAIREEARKQAREFAEEDKQIKIQNYRTEVFEKERQKEYEKQMKPYDNIDTRTSGEKVTDIWNKVKDVSKTIPEKIGEGYARTRNNLQGTGTAFKQDVGRTFSGAGSGFIKNVEKSNTTKKQPATAVQQFSRSITMPQAATEQINLMGAAQRPTVLNRGTQPLHSPSFGGGGIGMISRKQENPEQKRVNFLLGKNQEKPQFNNLNLLGNQNQSNPDDRINRLRRFL